MHVYDNINDQDSFTELYQRILLHLLQNPDHVIAPRGLKINELVNATIVIDPDFHIINFAETGAPDRQEAYDRYRKAELEWYLSGNTLASSAPSKFWGTLAQPDGHITSNYGHMMLFDKKYPSQPTIISDLKGLYASADDSRAIITNGEMQTALDRVVETLTKDPDSRQAIVHYNEPRHCFPQNKDFPCTMYSQFFVRDGWLEMTTYQRSCDIIKGFSYDVPWSCHFLDMVLKRLQAAGLQLQGCASFTHVFGSLHLYHKDLELAEKIVRRLS